MTKYDNIDTEYAECVLNYYFLFFFLNLLFDIVISTT